MFKGCLETSDRTVNGDDVIQKDLRTLFVLRFLRLRARMQQTESLTERYASFHSPPTSCPYRYTSAENTYDVLSLKLKMCCVVQHHLQTPSYSLQKISSRSLCSLQSNQYRKGNISKTNKDTSQISVYLFSADYSPLHLLRPEQLLVGESSQGNF